MKITRSTLLLRGFSHRCPRCGRKSLFNGVFTMPPRCPHCHLNFEPGEGFYLGSMALNYGVTCVGFLLPILVITALGIWSTQTGIILALAGAIVFPALFYRSSRSWWLATYYMVLPHELTKPPLPHSDQSTE